MDFSDGLNFLVGLNAAGKTSILEAICLAFTGKALTVDDPKRLVREAGDAPSEIKIEFFYKLHNYTIERRLSKHRIIGSWLYVDGKNTKEKWNDVTEYLMKLLAIDANFFERVLYMSEGDVFRFISNPPRESIMRQIEEALGIDRMEKLVGAIESGKQTYETKLKELRTRRNQFRKMLPSTKESFSNLIDKQGGIQEEIESSRNQLASIDTRFSTCKERIEKIEDTISIIRRLQEQFSDLIDSSVLKKDFAKGMQKVIELLQTNQKEITVDIDAKTKRTGMLEERKRSLSEIVDLLKGVNKGKQKVNCPVCGRQLSIAEAIKIREHSQEKAEEVEENLADLIRDITQNREALDELDRKLQDMKMQYEELRKNYVDLKIKPREIEKLTNFLKSEMKKERSLVHKKEEIEETLSKLDKENQKVRQEIDRFRIIEELGKEENIESSLVSVSKAIMALSLLEKATRKTIRVQREKKLGPVYTEIEKVWNELRKGESSAIRFDDKAVPAVYRDGTKFDVQQLSGGEKIALFVIVRTVLCRRFTSLGFMLLDEPLEHLDYNNRRLVVDFLVESFEKGWVDQLFVTTFEESIVRKFADREQVNIVAV